MLFYRKGLRGRKTPLPFVVYARKAMILRGKIWSAHESDVVGVIHHVVDGNPGPLNLWPATAIDNLSAHGLLS